MEPNEAVSILRAELGMGLQRFATEIGVSMTSLVKYEAGRNPTGKVLLALFSLARAHRKPGLANAFFRAFLEDTEYLQRVRFYGFAESPDKPPAGFLFWTAGPESDAREHAALFALDAVLDEACSTDPETKERALQKLAAATKALTAGGAKRGKGRQG